MSIFEEMEEIVQQEFTMPSGSVFHYTDLLGYAGITRSGYFILNSHIFLNKKDKNNSEITYTERLIESELHAKGNPNRILDSYRDIIQSSIFYSASFSTNGDKRGLCADFGEYIIEISSDVLRNFENNNKLTLFGNVIYDEGKQKEIIKKLYDIWSHHGEDIKLIPQLLTYLLRISPLFKSKEHEYQEECRVIQLEVFDEKMLKSPIAVKRISYDKGHILSVRKL